MILPRISIQRPVLASMMSLALVLFGLIGLSRLPVRELPDIDPPIVSVTTVYPGADMNVVMTGAGNFVEIQGTAEKVPFTRAQMSTLLDLSGKGIAELVLLQRKALATPLTK